jgi:IS30 family transposase
MADDRRLTGQQDRSQISLSEDYEVRYWTQKFGVSEDELRAAVNRVGRSAKTVERELARLFAR